MLYFDPLVPVLFPHLAVLCAYLFVLPATFAEIPSAILIASRIRAPEGPAERKPDKRDVQRSALARMRGSRRREIRSRVAVNVTVNARNEWLRDEGR
jgi:hypothetical protein